MIIMHTLFIECRIVEYKLMYKDLFPTNPQFQSVNLEAERTIDYSKLFDKTLVKCTKTNLCL